MLRDDLSLLGVRLLSELSNCMYFQATKTFVKRSFFQSSQNHSTICWFRISFNFKLFQAVNVLWSKIYSLPFCYLFGLFLLFSHLYLNSSSSCIVENYDFRADEGYISGTGGSSSFIRSLLCLKPLKDFSNNDWILYPLTLISFILCFFHLNTLSSNPIRTFLDTFC